MKTNVVSSKLALCVKRFALNLELVKKRLVLGFLFIGMIMMLMLKSEPPNI